MHPDDRYALAAIGHGHGGGHHGGFRGRGGITFSPWWPMYESDVDGLYGEERDEQLAEKIAQKLAAKAPTAVGYDDGMSGLDVLGAETLTGFDWLNVLKNTAGQLSGSGDDKAKAEAKAKQEKALAAEKSSKWTWAAGAAVLGGLLGFFLGRR